MADQDINNLIQSFKEELEKLRSSSQLDEASKKHQQNIEKLLERNNKLSQEGVDKSKDQDFNKLLDETQKTNKQLKEDKKTAKLLEKLNQNQEENNQYTKENIRKNSKLNEISQKSSQKVNQSLAEQAASFKQQGSLISKDLFASFGSQFGAGILKGQFDNGIKSVPSSGTYMLEQGERVVSSDLNKDLTSYLSKQQNIGFGNQGETDKDIMLNIQNPEPVSNAMTGMTSLSNNEDKDGLKVQTPTNTILNTKIDEPQNLFDGMKMLFRNITDNYIPYHREEINWLRNISDNLKSVESFMPVAFFRSLVLSYREFMRHPIWNTLALSMKGILKLTSMIAGPIGRLVRNIFIGQEASIDKKQLNQLKDINNALYQVYDVQERRRGFEGFVEEGGLAGMAASAAKEASKSALSSGFSAVKGLFSGKDSGSGNLNTISSPDALEDMSSNLEQMNKSIQQGITIEGEFERVDETQGDYRTTAERRQDNLREEQTKSQSRMAEILGSVSGMFASFTSMFDKRTEEMIENQDDDGGWLSTIGRLLAPVGALLSSGFALLSGKIKSVFGNFGQLFKSKGIMGGLMTAGKGLAKRIPGLMMIFDAVQMITDMFSGDFSNIGENLGQIVGAGLGGMLGTFLGPIGTVVGSMIGRFLFGHIGESLQKAFGEADGIFDFIYIFFTDIGSKLWSGIKWVVSKWWDVFTFVWSGIWEGIKWLGSAVIDGVWFGIKWLGSSIWSAFWGILKWVGSKVWGGIKWVGNLFMDGILNFLNGIISAINEIPGVEIEKFKTSESQESRERRERPRVSEDTVNRDRGPVQVPMAPQQGQQEQQDRRKEQEMLGNIEKRLKELNNTTQEGNKQNQQSPAPEPTIDDVNTTMMLSYQ